MDPISALGLASNVVQFVEFGISLFTGAQTIYQSASAMGEENRILYCITADLQRLSDSIIISNDANKDLQDLAEECKCMCGEFLQQLKKLSVQGTKTKWKSFKAVLREAWSRDKVDKTSKRLGEMRHQLNIHVQHLIRYVSLSVPVPDMRSNISSKGASCPTSPMLFRS
jgi:hypothetical protein